MDIEQFLRSFIEKATREFIAPAVCSSKQAPALGISASASGGRVEIVKCKKLVGPAFHEPTGQMKPGALMSYVESELARPGVDAVITALEGWSTMLPTATDEQRRLRFGHLSPGADGRAEVCMCAVYTKDVQTGVIHGISRLGKSRRLVPGPVIFEGLTLGGRMVREAPTLH
jgi:hypothetical protein